MKEQLKISIVTINYNNKNGLKRTIESVISQTYPFIEYIVIDGNSTDGSKEVIEKYKNRISYWVSEPDSGIYNAMNKGVEKATGVYLLFLNSGDCLHSDSTITDNICYLETGEDLIMGQVKLIPSGKLGWDDILYPLTMKDFYEGGPIPHQACFIKNSLFKDLRYDEHLKIVSDWKFFMQVIVFKKCSYKIVKSLISDFEEGGLSADRYLCDKERNLVLKELLPDAILADYVEFSNGKGYVENQYNSFFIALKKYNYRYSKLVYMLSVFVTKIISLVKPSLRFSRDYPTFFK